MSNLEQLPPNIQEKIGRLQQLQNTMQQLVQQRQRLDLEINETDRALKNLEELSSDTKVYRSVGSILFEKSKDGVVKDLTERREFLEMRSKVLTKQESKTRERLSSLQKSLQEDLNVQLGAKTS
jgi:prefoldin beta subunit